jgi:hypothetical protein
MHLKLLRMKNFSDKSCRKNKHFLKKLCRLRYIVEKVPKGYSLQYGAFVLYVG